MRRLGALLALALAAWPCAGRMISPLRKNTAIHLLRRLADGSPDLISIDIGGTLAKVVLFQPQALPPSDGTPPPLELSEEALRDDAFHQNEEQFGLSVYSPSLNGALHFFVFESRHVGAVIDFVARHLPADGIRMRATGGGAHKHADDFRRAGLVLDLEDEMGAIVAGLCFLLREIPGELFAVNMDALGEWTPLATPAACASNTLWPAIHGHPKPAAVTAPPLSSSVSVNGMSPGAW